MQNLPTAKKIRTPKKQECQENREKKQEKSKKA